MTDLSKTHHRAMALLGCLGGLVLATVGCSDDEGERAIRVHQPIQASKPILDTGEDCTVSGQSACRSGYCLHVSPKTDEDYFCTTSCEAGEPLCPSGWSCVQLLPMGSFCTPPKNWSSRRAASGPPRVSPRQNDLRDAGRQPAAVESGGDGGSL